MFIEASIARCWPFFTGSRAGACVVGVGSLVPSGTVTVGPVPAAVASALSALFGSGSVMSASRKVTCAGPRSPNARMRNFVITPSIGAPADDGSPLGFVGTMN